MRQDASESITNDHEKKFLFSSVLFIYTSARDLSFQEKDLLTS